jgi:thioredoxin-dependent peroxiredoxin
MKTLITILIIAFSQALPAQNGLNTGDRVPAFEATADDGTTWRLKDNLVSQYLVVYFYPAAMTGGCTAQACNYRDMGNELKNLNASVVGVSGDNPEGLKFFREAHNLNFTLISDESGKIARIFGVPVREGGVFKNEFKGQQFELERGVTTGRWTFILDKEGRVAYKNEQVNVSKDTEEVIKFLKSQK